MDGKGLEMSQRADFIDDAIKTGKLTVSPPAPAAGEHKPTKKKKRRGERIRPCARCEVSVKFIKGAWRVNNQRRRGWHWVNEDGSHHRCGDFR